jgi:SAM-dependent methyltransferase
VNDPGAFWDGVYGGSRDHVYGTEPNAFLRAQATRLPLRGRALSVADGEGRNGVWLAGQGLSVLTVDLSPRGIDKARRLAAVRGVALDARHGDVLERPWGDERFDVVASIFLHSPPPVRPRLHGVLADALAPGGLLVLEAFHRRQLGRGSGGPPSVDLLFTADLLRADFAGLSILQLEEAEVVLDEGAKHRGPAEVVRLVARRPE